MTNDNEITLVACDGCGVVRTYVSMKRFTPVDPDRQGERSPDEWRHHKQAQDLQVYRLTPFLCPVCKNVTSYTWMDGTAVRDAK